MNRLQHESSPYLQQHANNPVNWYAWRPEAFERAQKENKPILVSIGYSTCHWCHVMERESFENEQVAAFMNEYFINIKVDREERPDVDQIYMEACQAISGSGGWPLNAFLTPDGRPFFAGTYYPPAPLNNRPSWKQLLQRMVYTFREKREVVEDQANRLMKMIESSDLVFFRNQLEIPEGEQDAYIERVFQQLLGQFDHQHGGFGGAPKFPSAMSLAFLLDYYFHKKEPAALKHVQLSLDKMLSAGLYDHLGGGFARYATDRAWRVPHFEKMLYDNALLVSLLSEAYKYAPKTYYGRSIRQTIAFIEREMTHPEGGFYSALDADSEGVEGKFYLWSTREIKSLVPEAADWFIAYYQLQEEGNWEGSNILWRTENEKAFFEKYPFENQEAFQKELEAIKSQLLEARAKRVRPGRDEKVLLGWNALMSSAYIHAGRALREASYFSIAERNLEFLLDRFSQKDQKGLLHSWKDGQAQYAAFLDDYALLIAALLDASESTGRLEWIRKADDLTAFVLEHFLDHSENLFYFTSKEQEDLILRKKEVYDNATPSGNSTMVQNLLRLAVYLDRSEYQDLAGQMLKKIQPALSKYPNAFARWGRAYLQWVYSAPEVAIVGPSSLQTLRSLQATALPQAAWIAAREGTEDFPLLKGKTAGAKDRIFICENYACRQPVSEVEAALELLRPQ